MIIEPDEFPYRFPALKFHVDFKTAQAPIDSAEEAAKEVQSEGLTRLFFGDMVMNQDLQMVGEFGIPI